MSRNETILITGAGGQLGQLTLDHLLAAGHRKLIATTRNPAKLAAYAARGVEVRFADFADPTTLAAAFAGADRALLISTDAVGARLAQHRAAIDAFVAAGIDRVLYTSWINADRSPALVSADHVATERAIESSGLSYVILRNAYYAENLLGSLEQIKATGQFFGARGDGRVAFVARTDCAAAAAGALLSDDSSNQILDVTGPAALSFADVARVWADALGRDVRAVDLSPLDFATALMKAGLPAPVAELLTSFEMSAKRGDGAGVSTAVRTLSGVEPTSLRDVLVAGVRGNQRTGLVA